jgi:transcriptional regulator with XRE-family HTH domain
MPAAFGPLLLDLLAQRGLSGLRFAKLVYTGSSTISQVASGKRTPPLSRIEAWADVLSLRGAARARFIELAHLAHCPERIQREYLWQQDQLTELTRRIGELQDEQARTPQRAAER